MLKSTHVLIADDDNNGRRMLEILISKLGCQVSTAPDGEVALEVIRNTSVDLLITDLNMPKIDGLKLLSILREENNDLPVIVITAYGTVESAVAAMKQGAIDFIMRPLNVGQVEVVIKHAFETSRLKQENLFLRDQLDNSGWGEFIGQSRGMLEIYDLIRQVAKSNASVFIAGETGTGKELVARAIHRSSGRNGLFVPINCAAIPASILESELFGYVRGAFTGAVKDRVGKFEAAHTGTLFLDEITEMDLDIQAKLLRVLQENTIERLGSNRSFEIDIRIIAATNRHPRDAVEEGRLREDVFYRLNVFNIMLPPLRDRKEDIPLLAEKFTERYSKKMGYPGINLSKAAVEELTDYSWPGNVRELENVIERAVVLSRGGKIEVDHLPKEMLFDRAKQDDMPINQDASLETCVSELEVKMINNALQNAQGNKAKAARSLSISERTLWYKLKKYKLGTINAEE
jgi:two-component system response regulator AtoC